MTKKEKQELKNQSNKEFLNDLIDKDPTGLTQMAIIDILSKGVKDYRPSDEQIRELEKSGKRSIINLQVWQETIDYISDRLDLKYGSNESKNLSSDVSNEPQIDRERL